MKLKPVLITIIAITAFVFTACNRGSETNTTVTELPAQLPAETSVVTVNERTEQVPAVYDPYRQILAGDLSNFAGTWVNINGEKKRLYADGVFDNPGTVSNFTKNHDRTSDAYRWWVFEGIDKDMEFEYGYFVYLYPAGVVLDEKNVFGPDFFGLMRRSLLPSDHTIDRILLRPIPQHDSLDEQWIFYREGELPVPVYSTADATMYQNYIGRWVEDPDYPRNDFSLEIRHINVEQNEIEFGWYRYGLGEFGGTANIIYDNEFIITNYGHPDIVWFTIGTLDFLENRILLTILYNDFPHFEDAGTTFHYIRQ